MSKAIPLAGDSSVVRLDQLASNDSQTIYFKVGNRTDAYTDLHFEDKSTRYEYAGKRREGVRVTTSDLSTIFTAAGTDRYECTSVALGQLIGEKKLLGDFSIIRKKN
jgi:hypothetical protein